MEVEDIYRSLVQRWNLPGEDLSENHLRELVSEMHKITIGATSEERTRFGWLVAQKLDDYKKCRMMHIMGRRRDSGYGDLADGICDYLADESGFPTLKFNQSSQTVDPDLRKTFSVLGRTSQ